MKTDPRMLDRREFTLEAALAALAGVTITVSGCGGGGSSPTAPSNPIPPTNPGDEVGTVSINHGHTAVITAAQLQAGDAVTLDIRGQSDHPHTVSLTTDQVMQIAGGARVSATSSNEQAHDHVVTFN